MVVRIQGMILFQFPIMVRHYQEVPMDLYQITIVLVPYHSNLSYPLKEEPNPYTEVKLTHDMLAMTEETNMAYNSVDLDLCIEVDQIHYCENMHLVQIESEPSCTSAIFYNIHPKIVKSKCNI